MRSEHPRNFFFLGARKKKFWAEPPADPRGTNIPESIFWEPERKNFGQSLRRTHEERTSQKEFSGSPNEKILGRASGGPMRNEHPRKNFLEARMKNFGQSLRQTHEERASQKAFSGSPNEK